MSLVTQPRTDPADPPTEGATGADARPRWRRLARRGLGWLLTGLAAALVIFGLVGPNDIAHLRPLAFVRVPLEGVLGVVLLLLLPPRARRTVAVVGGAILGLLTVVKVVDLAFYEILRRSFDPVDDWSLFASGFDFLSRSSGRGAAIGAAVVAGALALAVVVLMPLAVLRLSRSVLRHRTAATRSAVVLGAAWVALAALGAQFIPNVPIAARAHDRLLSLQWALRDQDAFVAELAVDRFRDTPGDQLLTGLRGKDVVVAFVESYGRDALENPAFAPGVGAVLDDGGRQLAAAGYGSRSGWLTSPVVGGNSWLAQATLLSGLWIDNQRRYRTLLKSDRLTLTRAFARADWRSVSLKPGLSRDWPEGSFFGHDRIYAAADLGYKGPLYSFGSVPDQYTLAAFERLERATTDQPVMAAIPLLSSHAPWSPVPDMVDWAGLGDGSAYPAKPAVPAEEWRNADRLRAGYGTSVQYSLRSLIEYVQTYGDEDLVLVFLGDHQPTPLVTGPDASRDVPITIVAKDPAVLARTDDWGWQDGLRPGPGAASWRMDEFRDRFMTTFR